MLWLAFRMLMRTVRRSLGDVRCGMQVLTEERTDMQISIYGILFVVSIILILILISIQFTLNQILKELRQLKNRVGYRPGEQDGGTRRR